MLRLQLPKDVHLAEEEDVVAEDVVEEWFVDGESTTGHGKTGQRLQTASPSKCKMASLSSGHTLQKPWKACFRLCCIRYLRRT